MATEAVFSDERALQLFKRSLKYKWRLLAGGWWQCRVPRCPFCKAMDLVSTYADECAGCPCEELCYGLYDEWHSATINMGYDYTHPVVVAWAKQIVWWMEQDVAKLERRIRGRR